MRFVKTAAGLAMLGSVFAGSFAVAQCQGRQNSGSTGQATAYTQNPLNTAYNQFPLNSGYNQNPLNPFGYNQQALAPMLALEQYSRNQRMMAAMQVQAQSLALQSQISQAQSMAKQMNKAGAEKRKAAQQERSENLALRQERESAKRSKNSETQRSTTRLASVE